MRRPNKLDWLIYRIFRWWWNPILVKRRHILFGLQAEIEKWLKNNPAFPGGVPVDLSGLRVMGKLNVDDPADPMNRSVI